MTDIKNLFTIRLMDYIIDCCRDIINTEFVVTEIKKKKTETLIRRINKKEIKILLRIPKIPKISFRW